MDIMDMLKELLSPKQDYMYENTDPYRTERSMLPPGDPRIPLYAPVAPSNMYDWNRLQPFMGANSPPQYTDTYSGMGDPSRLAQAKGLTQGYQENFDRALTQRGDLQQNLLSELVKRMPEQAPGQQQQFMHQLMQHLWLNRLRQPNMTIGT